MNQKILVIDDNEGDLELMEIYFKEAGFSNIFTALSGAEGISIAEKERPEIVVTDTNLPIMNGFEIAQKIKSMEGFNTWVILITGAIEGLDEEKVKASGVDDYCTKTIEFEKVIAAIHEGIKKIS